MVHRGSLRSANPHKQAGFTRDVPRRTLPYLPALVYNWCTGAAAGTSAYRCHRGSLAHKGTPPQLIDAYLSIRVAGWLDVGAI